MWSLTGLHGTFQVWNILEKVSCIGSSAIKPFVVKSYHWVFLVKTNIWDLIMPATKQAMTQYNSYKANKSNQSFYMILAVLCSMPFLRQSHTRNWNNTPPWWFAKVTHGSARQPPTPPQISTSLLNQLSRSKPWHTWSLIIPKVIRYSLMKLPIPYSRTITAILGY